MSPPYTFIADLAREAEPPADGILSRTVFNDDHVKAVVFGFGADQELSEHTAAMPAVLHFLSGEATVTLGDHTFDVRAGAFAHMSAGLRHAIRAKAPTVMLLLLLKRETPPVG
jgi:quercetin dioxygenase-like cupin family protein